MYKRKKRWRIPEAAKEMVEMESNSRLRRVVSFTVATKSAMAAHVGEWLMKRMPSMRMPFAATVMKRPVEELTRTLDISAASEECMYRLVTAGFLTAKTILNKRAAWEYGNIYRTQ